MTNRSWVLPLQSMVIPPKRKYFNPSNSLVQLADEENPAAAIALNRLSPQAGALELVGRKRHSAAAAQPALYLRYSHAASRLP